jgi:hypothetical protein
MATKLMVEIAFGGGLGDPEFTKDQEWDSCLDPDLAAAELRQAGYDVILLPEKYAGRLEHPLDDFLEAFIVGPDDPKVIDAIMNEVDGIVGKYGEACIKCGPVGGDHVPFAELFDEAGRP